MSEIQTEDHTSEVEWTVLAAMALEAVQFCDANLHSPLCPEAQKATFLIARAQCIGAAAACETLVRQNRLRDLYKGGA